MRLRNSYNYIAASVHTTYAQYSHTAEKKEKSLLAIRFPGQIYSKTYANVNKLFLYTHICIYARICMLTQSVCHYSIIFFATLNFRFYKKKFEDYPKNRKANPVFALAICVDMGMDIL